MRKFVLLVALTFVIGWPTNAMADTVPYRVYVEHSTNGWQIWSGSFVYVGNIAGTRYWEYRVCNAPGVAYDRFWVFYDNDDDFRITSAHMWDADENEVWYKTYGTLPYQDPSILSDPDIAVDWPSGDIIARITMSDLMVAYWVNLEIVTGYCP